MLTVCSTVAVRVRLPQAYPPRTREFPVLPSTPGAPCRPVFLHRTTSSRMLSSPPMVRECAGRSRGKTRELTRVSELPGQFALSSSWDKTLRLWDLNTGLTTRQFLGHTADVLSVSFSADNRQIVSGSRDRTIKLWNTLGECKFNIQEDGHTEWVSCVRFSPNPLNPVIVSAGWDKVVKVSRFSCPVLRA